METIMRRIKTMDGSDALRFGVIALLATLAACAGIPTQEELDHWRSVAAETTADVQQLKAELEKTANKIVDTESVLEQLRTSVPDTMTAAQRAEYEAIVAEAQAELADLEAHKAKLLAMVDEGEAWVVGLNQRIQAAETWPEMIQGVVSATAPLTGPAAPWVLLASNIATMFLSKRSAASKIVVPIERARNRDLEAKLRQSPEAQGRDFVVFDKSKA